MDSSTYRGLAFLLSLGTLPACKTDEGTTDSGTTGTTGTTGMTGGLTDGTTVGASTETGAATGTGSATGTGAGSTGDPTGGQAGPCDAYVAWSVMCDPTQAGMEEVLLKDCEASRKSQEVVYGAACLTVYDEYILCVSQAACDDPNACEAEAMAAYGCSPEIGPACKAYAAKYVECMLGDNPDAEKYCQVGINFSQYTYGPACGTALEELYACMATLSCAELEMDTGCDAQRTAVTDNCG